MFKRLTIFLLLALPVAAGDYLVHPAGYFHHPSGYLKRTSGAAPAAYWNDAYSNNLIGMYYLDDVQRSNTYECVQCAVDANTGIGGSGGALFWKYDTGYFFNNSQYLTNAPIMTNCPATFTNATFSIWCTPSDATLVHQGIIGFTRTDSKYGEFGLARVSATQFRSYLNDTVGDFTYAWTSNTTYHFAGTYDGANYIVYMNGQRIYTNTVGGVLTPGTNCFGVGVYYTASRVLHGSAKDARMYLRTMTDADINTIYTNGYLDPDIYAVSTNGLLVWYPFDTDRVAVHSESTNKTIFFPMPTWANAPTRVAVGTNVVSSLPVYAHNFDGADDYFNMDFTAKYQQNEDPKPLKLGVNDFTISCWVRPETFASANKGILGIAAATNGYYALKLLKDTGVVQFEVDGASTTGTYINADSGVPTNAWTHIWIQRDFGVELAMWVNGVKQADAKTETNDINYAGSLSVLSLCGQGGAILFDGSIRDVRFYNFCNTNVWDVFTHTHPVTNYEQRIHVWVNE